MPFTITQDDTSPALSSTLTDGGQPVDITGYNEVEFHMENKYQEIVINEDTTGRVSVVDAASGRVSYTFGAEDTENVGTYWAEWQVTYDSGNVETFPSGEKLKIEITEETA